jgi:hypothetical protein
MEQEQTEVAEFFLWALGCLLLNGPKRRKRLPGSPIVLSRSHHAVGARLFLRPERPSRVLEPALFLTANGYERGLFKANH